MNRDLLPLSQAESHQYAVSWALERLNLSKQSSGLLTDGLGRAHSIKARTQKAEDVFKSTSFDVLQYEQQFDLLVGVMIARNPIKLRGLFASPETWFDRIAHSNEDSNRRTQLRGMAGTVDRSVSVGR